MPIIPWKISLLGNDLAYCRIDRPPPGSGLSSIPRPNFLQQFHSLQITRRSPLIQYAICTRCLCRRRGFIEVAQSFLMLSTVKPRHLDLQGRCRPLYVTHLDRSVSLLSASMVVGQGSPHMAPLLDQNRTQNSHLFSETCQNRNFREYLDYQES